MNSKVSIIVLNWNNYNDSAECLESLNNIDFPNCEIILVDNASEDGSAERLKMNYPNISLIKNHDNYGYAKGNNVGIKQALKNGADYVLLLNNDTVVDQHFLTPLVMDAEADNGIGIVGPKIYFYNSNIVWYAGGKLNPLTGFTYHLGEGEEDKGQFNDRHEVDFVSGCAMLVKRAVFEKVGLLDEDYYHGHEDADFCLRAKKFGFKCIYEPKAVIFHKLAVASGGRRSPFYLYYRTRNHLIFKKKREIRAPFYVPIFIMLVLKRILGSLLLGQPKGAFATIVGICDYYSGNWAKGNGDAYRN